MKAFEALRAGRDLLRAGLVDVDASWGEAPDAAAGFVVDPDATPVPDDLMPWIHADLSLVDAEPRKRFRLSDHALSRAVALYRRSETGPIHQEAEA